MRYAVIRDKIVTNIIEMNPEDISLFFSVLDCNEIIESETLGMGDRYEGVPETIIPSEAEIIASQILDLQHENQLLGQQLVAFDLRLLMGGI